MEVFFCALVHTGCFVSIFGEAVCVFVDQTAGWAFFLQIVSI